MTLPINPRWSDVTGTPFHLQCLNCGERGHSDGSAGIPNHWFADLNGPPFEAYYCENCVQTSKHLTLQLTDVAYLEAYLASADGFDWSLDQMACNHCGQFTRRRAYTHQAPDYQAYLALCPDCIAAHMK